MEIARVNPVGILEGPAGGGSERRPPSRRARLCAVFLLLLFAFVTVATTVASLGAFCLTTEPGDLRSLPASSRR
jgi:hypothetical protein